MFKDRIRENYDDLTPGFRKLADFIMDNSFDVAFMTATKLARRVGVDPATVVRFSQELRYSGYRELSREIKDYVRERVTAPDRAVDDADTSNAVLTGLINHADQAMRQFVTSELEGVTEAVNLIAAANTLWITGEFTYFDLASFLAKKFLSYGQNANAFQPGIVSTSKALVQMEAGDALLAFAGTEASLDTGYAVRMAKKKGLQTVAIVGSGVILPAREADVTVTVPQDSPAGISAFGLLFQITSFIWEAVMVEREPECAEYEKQLFTQMNRMLQMRTETSEFEVTSPQKMWESSLDDNEGL
jgi:DNA-binding MurR/RpiR family transcriptional regulator